MSQTAERSADGAHGSPPFDARPSSAHRLRRALLGINPAETALSARGFTGGQMTARAILDRHAAAFAEGYNAALACDPGDELSGRLGAVDHDDRGFAYEGAAMALTLLDLAPIPGHDRLGQVLNTHGQRHRYLIHVGAGWALARLRRAPATRITALDPRLRWLATDGYGFHDGFFHAGRAVQRHRAPRRTVGYAQHAYDQGLGRSLWFVAGAEPAAASRIVGGFAPERRGDLWSGLGLAAAYTTAADELDLTRLREYADQWRWHLAQGAAFALTARDLARNVVPHTVTAARVLCEADPRDVLAHVSAAEAASADGDSEDAYERWRTDVRRRLQSPW